MCAPRIAYLLSGVVLVLIVGCSSKEPSTKIAAAPADESAQMPSYPIRLTDLPSYAAGQPVRPAYSQTPYRHDAMDDETRVAARPPVYTTPAATPINAAVRNATAKKPVKYDTSLVP